MFYIHVLLNILTDMLYSLNNYQWILFLFSKIFNLILKMYYNWHSKGEQLSLIAYIHFIWTLVDSCLIAISAYSYIVCGTDKIL